MAPVTVRGVNEAAIHRKLDLIYERLGRIEAVITQAGRFIMSALDDLTAQVAANTSVEQSAVTLIQGLAAEIAANAGDPAKIAALASQLKASGDALAAAVVANTAPPPPATP